MTQILITFDITFALATKALTDTFYDQDAKGRVERIKALTPLMATEMITNALKCHGTFGQRLPELQDKAEFEYYSTIQDEVEHWLRHNYKYQE